MTHLRNRWLGTCVLILLISAAGACTTKKTPDIYSEVIAAIERSDAETFDRYIA